MTDKSVGLESRKLSLRRWLTPIWVSLVVLPVITCGLWLGSGGERLTKPIRTVQVEVEDKLFGDSSEETLLISGPILGYYVGLDAVVVTSAFSLILLASAGVRKRMRRRNAGESGQEQQ